MIFENDHSGRVVHRYVFDLDTIYSIRAHTKGTHLAVLAHLYEAGPDLGRANGVEDDLDRG